jgi:type IV pilus assembly protein PilX
MRQPRKQSGVVLVITLIILLILTLLGTSSIQMTGLLERMARNTTDTNAALGAAEAGLLAAESLVEAETGLTAYEANTAGKYKILGTGVTPRWQNPATWNASDSLAATHTGSAIAPRYIIEFVTTVVSAEDSLNLDNVGGDSGTDQTQVFRITALGVGKSESAKVYLQTTYGKKF